MTTSGYDDIDSEYPYGPPRPVAAVELAPSQPNWIIRAIDGITRTVEAFFSALQRPPDFVVPRTFGMSAILGIMTVLAIAFALLRWLDSYPVFYFFFSAQALGICLAQMLYGKTPRLASILAGAILLPVFTLVSAALVNSADWLALGLAIVFVPFGAFLGYLTGACAAGVFLIMSYLERMWLRQTGWLLTRTRPTP